MDGIFSKQRFAKFQNILGLISGVALVLMFGLFLFLGEFQALGDRILSLFFALFGLFVCLISAVSLHVNRKAFIHVDEQKISAFCHYGLTLECDLSEVSNVSYGYSGLSIRLKSGKEYSLMNLQNECSLGCYIQERLCAGPTWEQIVEYMQDKGLSCCMDAVVHILPSKDRSKRILILKSDHGYFKTAYEEIRVWDEDERNYFSNDPNRYPANWEPVASPINSSSFYSSEADALREVKNTPEYIAYFE